MISKRPCKVMGLATGLYCFVLFHCIMLCYCLAVLVTTLVLLLLINFVFGFGFHCQYIFMICNFIIYDNCSMSPLVLEMFLFKPLI